MSRTPNKIGLALGSAIALGAAALALAQAPPGAAEPLSYQLMDFGSTPRPAPYQVFLQMPAIEAELKLTEAQKKAQEAIMERHFEKIQKARREAGPLAKVNAARRKAAEAARFSAALQQAARTAEAQKPAQEPTHDRPSEKIEEPRPDSSPTSPPDFPTLRERIFNETQAAIRANLEPWQRERLDEIQLQVQGPLAFTLPDSPFQVFVQSHPDLKLSEYQLRQVRTIADEGEIAIDKASTFSIPRNPSDGPLTTDAVRKLVATPEFQADKAKARQATREARDAMMQRIDQVLTNPQRTAYRKLLGPPFDLSKLDFLGGRPESDRDAMILARNAGGGGGQRADLGFDVKIARPTFTNVHPRVAIDHAHDNFHTADGRYKPFADLMTNDGYLVSPNTEKLSSKTLEPLQILVIANASLGDGEVNVEAPKSAFTIDECLAVQRWVWAGGSLLLITDHEPFGSASEALARRFAVVMNTSGTVDPANSDDKNGGLVFSRERQLILDHPITIGREPSERINRVETFYGQALIGPVGSTAFLRFSDSATYQSENGQQSAAGWAQGVALGYGAGRVVVMGEAAELSAQLAGLEPMGMNVPGIDNRQMALNIMHWLSGQLEPQWTTVPAGFTYAAPPRRRLLPRLFVIRPGPN
jgi:hypothetical protein